MSAAHPLIAQLAARRRELGLSQERLAARIYVGSRTVSWWETGRSWPPVDRIESYAKAVGMRLALLPADARVDNE
ncbi:helix-turn-helix domain-containing protein [Streptosporangium vulgare]|uniref:Helix-turn-helix domain-containing protein n=1 Tax=Streptosporangium vulgare TaxID=46190 RepID=A0ABV5TQJ0_9ACTN